MAIPLSEVRYVETALVEKQGVPAATLSRTNSAIEFKYLDGYAGGAIATTLPAGVNRVTTGGRLPNFFSNLLPEAARALGLATRLKTSADDELSLLIATGADLVGDVTVRPLDDELEPTPHIGNLRDAEREALGGIDRSGLAGIQNKISDQMLTFAFQSPRAPSILKLGAPAYPLLLENERFFLEAARLCKIAVAKADLVTDESGVTALRVQRFDRLRENRTWQKRPQEDSAQLLDIAPADKYRPSLRNVAFSIQQVAAAPSQAMLMLLEQVAFSYLIGNGDQHAKNISVFNKGEGWVLTPAYDVLSTLPYADLDQHTAFKMEGRNANLKRARFIEAFGEYGLPERAVVRVLDRLIELAPKWTGRIGEIGFDGATTERVEGQIATRLRQLQGD